LRGETSTKRKGRDDISPEKRDKWGGEKSKRTETKVELRKEKGGNKEGKLGVGNMRKKKLFTTRSEGQGLLVQKCSQLHLWKRSEVPTQSEGKGRGKKARGLGGDGKLCASRGCRVTAYRPTSRGFESKEQKP